MKKLIPLIFCLFLTSQAWGATDIVTDFTPESVPVLNEELRKITEEIDTVSATLPTDLNITGQTSGDLIQFNGTNWVRLADTTTGGVGASFDNGTSNIIAGTKTWVYMPYSCTITGWTILIDRAPTTYNCVVDIWKDAYASYPPTVADKISGSESPACAPGAVKAQDLSLTTWTDVTVDAGDVLVFNVLVNGYATGARKIVVLLHTTR